MLDTTQNGKGVYTPSLLVRRLVGCCHTVGCVLVLQRRLPMTIVFLVITYSLYGAPEQTPKNKQGPETVTPIQHEVDSLNSALKSLSSQVEKGEIYGQLSILYAGTLGDVVKARLYADSLGVLARALGQPLLVARSDYYYGVVERYEGKNPQAIDHLQRHVDYCHASGDSSQLGNTFYQMATIQQSLGNYDESLSLGYKAIDLHEKMGSAYGKAICFIHLGTLYSELKDVDRAIVMQQQALIILDTLQGVLKVKMNRLRGLMNLGSAYTTLKQYDKAREFYDQSLVISRFLGSKRTTGTCLSNIGNIYTELGKYDSALAYHLMALEIREQLAQKDKILISLLYVGQTYMTMQNYTMASEVLSRALRMAKDFHAKPSIRDAYEKLSTLYATQQDFQKAYEYHQLAVAMNDSVLNDQTARKLSELQTRYETGEKDKQLAMLAKEKEIQNKESKRQAILSNVSLAGLVSVAMVAALVYYVFRQRLRLITKNDEVNEADCKRRLSELEMKALRAQINPHFLFNCMNAINLMILKGQTENASRYLGKFSRLVRLILESAEASFVSLESEVKLLESYIQLEELRLPGRIGYTISVDPSIGVEHTYMPSMVLQPVVENAIWHGIVHKSNDLKGSILIDVRQRDDQLLCTIEDNGVGRDRAKQLRDNAITKKWLGMKITEERLRLRNRNFRGDCIQYTDLKDTDNHAVGTRVILHIPIAEAND